MKKLLRKLFIHKARGSIGVGILAGIMIALGSVLIFMIAIPMAMEGERQNTLNQALLTLAENDYVAYGAPSGDWTTLGDLYTQDIYPQADSTYDIGTNTNRYRTGYFDNLVASNITGAGSGDMTKAVYDPTDSGSVLRADTATTAGSATTAGTATNQSGGTVNATEIKDDDLTSGRVTLATTDGKLTDDPDLAWDSGSNTLNTVTLNATSMNVAGQYASIKFTCTVTLDWNNGNVQYIVLANGDQTFTFANPKDGGRYLIILKQPASGAAGTVTWPGNILWPSSTTPTLTATNSKVDIVSFVYDGTNNKYYGGANLNY